MASSKDKNNSKRCPACGGTIDYFGSCRKCGREWSEGLEEDEPAKGLPEGQQHESTVVKKVGSKPTRKSRFTKSKAALAGTEFKSFATPSKFEPWMIDVDNDNDTEIIRKRSLMRLDSRKIYNAMGLAMRSHDSQKAALLWFERMWEFLEPEERTTLAPTVEILRKAYADLVKISQAKIAAAADMEKALEKAHKRARAARLRIVAEEAKKQAAEKTIMPGQDTEGYGSPTLVALPPDVLLASAKEKLLTLDEEKASRKKVRPRVTDDEDLFE